MVDIFDLLNHSEDSGEDSKSPSILSNDSGMSSSEATSSSTPNSMASNLNSKSNSNSKSKLLSSSHKSTLGQSKSNSAPAILSNSNHSNHNLKSAKGQSEPDNYSSKRPKINPLPQNPKVDEKGIVNPSANRIYKLIPRSKLHRKFLNARNFVQIAIRRKSVSKKPLSYNNLDEEEEEEQFNENNSNSKLHIKSLEAGLRVKLTLAPSLFSLYKSLTPNTNRKSSASVMKYDPDTQKSYARIISQDRDALQDYNDDIDDREKREEEIGQNGLKAKNNKLVSKSVQLIDSNLVDLTKTSNKVLKTFNLTQLEENNYNDSDPVSPKSKSHNHYHSPDLVLSQRKRKSSNENTKKKDVSPTFNSLSTAVQSLFGLTDYTLIRVTRSTTNDSEGSVLLKLETAKPGDYKLFDDNEFLSEMAHSIGQKDTVPSNLFLKKIVARPRYKSDMKIYLIPKLDDISFYIDNRMFERDLFHGIIDFDIPLSKKVYCNFEIDDVIDDFRNILTISESEHQAERQRKELAAEQYDEETDTENSDEIKSDSSSSQQLRSKPESLKLNSNPNGYFAPNLAANEDTPAPVSSYYSNGYHGVPEPVPLIRSMSEKSPYSNFSSPSSSSLSRPYSSSGSSSVMSSNGLPPISKTKRNSHLSHSYMLPSPISKSSNSIPTTNSLPSLSGSTSSSTNSSSSSNSLATPSNGNISSSTSLGSVPSYPLPSPKFAPERHRSSTTLPPPTSILNYIKEQNYQQ